MQEVERLHEETGKIERKLRQKIRRLKKENKRCDIQIRQQEAMLENYKQLAERILEGNSQSILL